MVCLECVFTATTAQIVFKHYVDLEMTTDE